MNGTVVRAVTRALVASAIAVAATLGLATSASAHPSTHSLGAHCLDGAMYEVWVSETVYLVPLHASC